MIRLRVLVDGRTRLDRLVHPLRYQATLDIICLHLITVGNLTDEEFVVVAERDNIATIVWRAA